MSQQLTDPIADGQAWADRQQNAFPAWVARYGRGDPAVWDFGLDSLDVLTYIVFDEFPTTEAIDDSANAAFSEPATWYLGEIIRRRNPQKLRWSRDDYGLYEGHYVIESSAKKARDTKAPRIFLDAVAASGDPLWLRSRYSYGVAPLWDKPYPPWILASENGAWSWDEAGQRWCSQRDQWLESIAGLVATLSAQLADVPLDYSTASLEAVEAFTVNNATAMDGTVRDAVIAYIGECLLRTGGDKWIWDDRPDSYTHGFPVVERSTIQVSPTHVVQYACARPDRRTFARIYRAWIAEAEDSRARAPEYTRQRELTPGLDFVRETPPVEIWANEKRARFPDWAARYGGPWQWDFSRASMDSLLKVMLQYCPVGKSLLHAPAGDDFIDGVVWYFGETMHRAKPSRWRFNDDLPARWDRPYVGLQIAANKPVDAGYPMAVPLAQVLEMALRFRPDTGAATESEINSASLSKFYVTWAAASIHKRIESSQRRREKAKNRAKSQRPDEEILASWIAARTDGFPQWIGQYGSETQWDFSADSLDALEDLIRHAPVELEDLLEVKANADFLEGAIWYYGEVLRRVDPAHIHWSYQRSYHPEPYLNGWDHAPLTQQLAEVYAEQGILHHWYEVARERKELDSTPDPRR